MGTRSRGAGLVAGINAVTGTRHAVGRRRAVAAQSTHRCRRPRRRL